MAGRPHGIAAPHLGAGMCQRRGSLFHRHLSPGIPGDRGGGSSDQDLRHRHQRARASRQPGPAPMARASRPRSPPSGSSDSSSRPTGGYEISKSVRDLCVFARQDLTRDPPFSQLDLISCRNVLIYLGPVLQDRVLPILHYALKPGGILVLGSSGDRGQLHRPVRGRWTRRHKIYVRTSAPSRLTFRLPSRDSSPGPGQPRDRGRSEAAVLPDVYREADRIVLARYAPSGVVVDEQSPGHSVPRRHGSLPQAGPRTTHDRAAA